MIARVKTDLRVLFAYLATLIILLGVLAFLDPELFNTFITILSSLFNPDLLALLAVLFAIGVIYGERR